MIYNECTSLAILDSSKNDSSSIFNDPFINRKITKLKLLDYCIPASWYQIDDDYFNNYLTINEGSADITISIENGSYSMATLISCLQTALNASGSTTLTYTITYNANQMSITVSATADFTIIESDLSLQLGFDGSRSTPATSHETTKSYQASNQDYILIDYDISTIANNSVNTDKTTFKNFINLSPFDSGDMVFNKFNTQHPRYELTEPTQISVLTVKLTDKTYVELDLRGLDYTLLFEIKYIA